MKFATIALIASASAVQLKGNGKGSGDCITKNMASVAFQHIDTSGDGQIDKQELVTAISEFAREMNHTVTKTEWAWIKKTG